VQVHLDVGIVMRRVIWLEIVGKKGNEHSKDRSQNVSTVGRRVIWLANVTLGYGTKLPQITE
jgi:hypothetical protein